MHHRVDEVFHDLPTFREGVQALRVDLRPTPLATGARRAVAHVGWELLLDDALADDAATVAAFRTALVVGRDAVDDRHWHTLVDRLLAVHPHPRSSPRVIAERVHRAVGRRPRLAFDAHDIEDVAVVLGRHQDPVTTSALDVVEAVTLATQADAR